MAIKLSEVSAQALIITNASIKNNVTTFISHVHIHNKLIIKMLHHTTNIMSIEAKLFAIRYGINQATNTDNILRIIIITDSLHTVKKIFDLSLHFYQSHSNFVLKELCNFFTWSQKNTIEFWEFLSHSKWYLHNAVNKNTKLFSLILLLPCKQ